MKLLILTYWGVRKLIDIQNQENIKFVNNLRNKTIQKMPRLFK